MSKMAEMAQTIEELRTAAASINAAARYLDVNPASIFKAIKKQKEYKGFYWEKKNA